MLRKKRNEHAEFLFLGWSQIGWWWHAPYEYKEDIKKIKETDTRYNYFPDELPQGARKVHWICRPGMIQGTGYAI